jgi:hypothetical protein
MVAVVVLSLGTTSAVLAERPAWTPIAQLLVSSLGQSDPDQLADVMTRCTALSMTLSGVTEDFSQEIAQLYRTQANRFIENALRIESQQYVRNTGKEPDMEALEAAEAEALKTMILGYSQWMDQNIAEGGSLFDKAIEMDMTSCQLTTRFVAQVPTTK